MRDRLPQQGTDRLLTNHTRLQKQTGFHCARDGLSRGRNGKKTFFNCSPVFLHALCGTWMVKIINIPGNRVPSLKTLVPFLCKKGTNSYPTEITRSNTLLVSGKHTFSTFSKYLLRGSKQKAVASRSAPSHRHLLYVLKGLRFHLNAHVLKLFLAKSDVALFA